MNTIDRFSGPYRFLSNFYVVAGTTTEHHYQAAKTTDPVWRARILEATTPAQAKHLGRSVPLRSDWESIKIPYMLELLRWKFSFCGLKKLLLDTGNAVLIEGNTWGDQFWGVCRGKGDNHLGRLLMQVRAELSE